MRAGAVIEHDAAAGVIECESFGPSIGRVSQRVTVGGHFDGFGTHPIAADAWLTRSGTPSRRTER